MKYIRVESEDTQKVTIRIDAGVYEYAKRCSMGSGETLALFIQKCIQSYERSSIDSRIKSMEYPIPM